MLWFVNNWRMAAVLGLCLGGLGLYWLGKHDGRQDAAFDAAKATAKAIQKRADIDEEVINLDAVALCKRLGGGVQCDSLTMRGLEADQR